MSEIFFDGKLGIQQRVLPIYRAPFFEILAKSCKQGLGILAGQPQPIEAITTLTRLQGVRYATTHNRHFLHPRHPFYLCIQEGVIQWLREWDPDVLIVEANPRYLSTQKAVRWMHQRNRPVIGWGLGAPLIKGRFSGLRNYARRRLLESLDGLISYSLQGAKEYRAIGIPAQQIYVAYNAVEKRPGSPPPVRNHSPGDRLTVLFVGRLQARKRIDLLLKACSQLHPTVQPRLVIIGDGPAKEDFQDTALKIYPEAEFTGALHGDELHPFYADSDLFVLPGTGGLAVQQAMAFGLPIIVAQGDGTQNDLVRPENGWQVPPGDISALQFALKEALSDPIKLKAMGAESYRIARDEVNLEVMAASFILAANRIKTAFQRSN